MHMMYIQKPLSVSSIICKVCKVCFLCRAMLRDLILQAQAALPRVLSIILVPFLIW